MKNNYKIIVEYDGTYFAGWQIQKDEITVQGELEHAISTILSQPIKVIGSGRTDSGVHAFGQVANFHADTDIAPNDLIKGLNSIIKIPIVVKSCEIVSPNFHARYNALSKEYHYQILNCNLPCAIGKDYVWHIKQKLDIDKMNQCCSILIGEYDFKSFEASGSPRANTVRTIYSAKAEYQQNCIYGIDTIHKDGFHKYIVFKVVGSGFLRFMVRNIVGTLVMVGLSKITQEEFKEILNSRNRTLAGATAPAKGLFLMNVNYN